MTFPITMTEPITQPTDPVERLRALLRPEEIADLTEHIEAVVTYKNGFGRIEIEFEYQRVREMAHRATSRPHMSATKTQKSPG